MKRYRTEAVIIGGGATGAGILRDCALRGIPALLIEKNDLASGTTGRNHGLLHSGARYAVNDRESAVECISENRILKKIAHHCIEETGGLFVTLPEDDPAYHDRLMDACRQAGIEREAMDGRKALQVEPNLNPDVVRAIRVPDGTIDPFRLASANVLDAREHGGRTFTHCEVTGFIMSGGRVQGVRCYDKINGEPFEVEAAVVVNASGVWGRRICELAGIDLKMHPSKGSMVIIDYRINNVVVNRCRKPSDGDILVPGDTVSLIGTTSRKISYDQIDDLMVDDDEIEVLLADGEKLVPNLSRCRVLRAYCGVRPLVAADREATGRDISRGIVLIDHHGRDGLDGLVTIAGGKLMTYRLMAEMATNLICEKISLKAACTTQETPLPGSEKKIPARKKIRSFSGMPRSVVGTAHYRHGERVHRILSEDKRNFGLVCECEMVTTGEVAYALNNLDVKDIIDLRRRTRIGMGPCQGELCSYRAAGLFTELAGKDGHEAAAMLIAFLEERWKGIRPVLWGDGLRETEFTYWIYQGLFGLGDLKKRIEDPE